MPGCFQFPQGGVDEGELPLDALKREVEEEVGYRPCDYEVLQACGGYRYDYPLELLLRVSQKRKKEYAGQDQTYFLCCLFPDAPEPELDGNEFISCDWIEPSDFRLSWLPEFKREVYRRVMKDFFGVDLSL